MDFVGPGQRLLAIVCLGFLLLFFIASVNISHASISTISTSLAACLPVVAPTPPPDVTVSKTTSQTMLYFNEVLLKNSRQWNCDTSAPKDNIWIELYNPNDEAYELSHNAYIDTGANTRRIQFLQNTVIMPHSFLIIFPFYSLENLDSDISLFRLFALDGPIDSTGPIPDLDYDQSYAHLTDGGPGWEIVDEPTFGTTNVIPPDPSPTLKPTKTPHPTSTPTPTKTPHPTSTPTPHQTSIPSKTPTAQQSDSGKPQTVLIDGTQPAWDQLAMASSSSVTPTPTVNKETPQQRAQTAPSLQEANADVPRKIILTVLATGLALTLFWCYRLFLAP